MAVSALMVLPLLALSPLLAASTDSSINVKVCQPAANPTITDPPDGTVTSQSSVLVSGNATQSTVVTAYRNGSQVGFVTAGTNGSYSISISLVSGTNTLHTSISNDCGEAASSPTVTVTSNYVPPTITPSPSNSPSPPSGQRASGTTKNLPPDPSKVNKNPQSAPEPTPETSLASLKPPIILEPANGTNTIESQVLVRGKADPLVMVSIFRNGAKVAEVLCDSDGMFSASVPLVDGENRLTAEANLGSQKTESSTTVVYFTSDRVISDSPSLVVAGLIVTAILSLILLIFLARKKFRR